MTKAEKEVLLALAYKSAYYARIQETKLRQERQAGNNAKAGRIQRRSDEANGAEETIAEAITRLYMDTGREKTLDFTEMVDALNNVGMTARLDADAEEKKTPRALRHYIKSLDVDDDEDAADEDTNCWVARNGDCK